MLDNSFQNELYVPSKEPWTTSTPSSAFDTRQKAVENRTTFDNIVSHYPPLTGCTCAARLKSATPLSGGRGRTEKASKPSLYPFASPRRQAVFPRKHETSRKGFLSRLSREQPRVLLLLHKGATSYVHPSKKGLRV